MRIANSRLVPAPASETWAALNDPDILKDCIPGCESLEKLTDLSYKVAMQAKVGPVSARFTGKLTLSDLKPPESYTVSFEGQGGAMGFGKGSAQVSLAAAPAGTDLSYVVEATVGGKLAQIGARLIDAAALKLADDFFGRFIERVRSGAESDQAGAGAARGSRHAASTRPPTIGAVGWIMIAVVVIGTVWLVWGRG